MADLNQEFRSQEERAAAEAFEARPKDTLESMRPQIEAAKSDPSLKAIVSQVNEEAERYRDVPNTALQALKIQLFNAFSKASKSEDRQILLEKIYQRQTVLNQAETDARNIDNPLPPIGIELEMPFSFASPQLAAALEMLGFYVYRDRVTNRMRVAAVDDKFEATTDFSYSADTQSRTVFELAQFVPAVLTKNPDLANIDYPLHVNLGIPQGIDFQKLNRLSSDFNILGSILMFAYTTVTRIKHREFDKLYMLKPANVSDKSDQVDGKSIRLELRAGQFRDLPTYQLLHKTQNLGAMLMAFLRKTSSLTLSEDEEELAALWIEFRQKAERITDVVSELLSSYGLQEAYIAEQVAARLSYQSTAVQESQSLITEYSNKVASLIRPTGNVI